MSLGTNISYLRKQKKITQEQFAEKMNVTRQTVSRWESGEITPELQKLVDMSELFACKLDALVKEELSVQKEIYSSIQIKRIGAFKMASYVMISPNPESDVIGYMERWAVNSGLKSAVSQVKCIGWDFPFVSQEQQNRFGMHGYVAACIPFVQPFERIPNAYKLIMEYLQANNFKEKQRDNIISCFEYEYTKNGVDYMDVFVHVDGVIKADAFSEFN